MRNWSQQIAYRPLALSLTLILVMGGVGCLAKAQAQSDVSAASPQQQDNSATWRPQGIGGEPGNEYIFGFPVDTSPNVKHFNEFPHPEAQQQPQQPQPAATQQPEAPQKMETAQPQPAQSEPVETAPQQPAYEEPAAPIQPAAEEVAPPAEPAQAQPEMTPPPVQPAENQPEMTAPEQPAEAPAPATSEPEQPAAEPQEQPTPQAEAPATPPAAQGQRANNGDQAAQNMFQAFCMKPLEDYKSSWIKRVNNWHVSRPEQKGTFAAVVKYTITKEGHVSNVRIAQSSGLDKVDEAAMGQIQSLTPDPFPECFNQDHLDFSHTFRLVNP